MNRFYLYNLMIPALLFAGTTIQGQTIPQQKSAGFASQIQAASIDSARASALLRYGDFLIDYNKDSAITVLKKALLLEGSGGRSFTLGKGHLLLGVSYAEKGAYPQAKAAYETAIHHFTRGSHYTELAKAHNNLSNLYNIQGMIEEAVAGYMKALSIVEKQGSNLSLGVIFNNIAAGLQKLGQHQTSLYYCNRGEAAARQKGDSVALVQLLLSKSAALLKTGKETAATACIREAYAISNQIPYTLGKAVSLINLADLHFDKNNFDSSLFYQLQAKSWAMHTKDPYYLNAVFYGLGKSYLGLKRAYDAETNLVEAKNLATELRDKEHLIKIWSTLSDVYATQGRYAQSLEALHWSNRYADSLRNETTSRRVNGLEARFRTAEKDKALAQQQLKLAQQRMELKTKNGVLILAVIALAALSVIWTLGYRNFRQQQRLQAQRLTALQNEKETEALHALIKGEEQERIRMARELHDGIGSELSAVRMYLEHLANRHPSIQETAPYREALALVEGAAVDIRQTAHNLMPELLHQHGLAEAVQTFCDKISRSHNLAVVFQYYGTLCRLQDRFELTVYRVVQELLHNTLRHAQATQAIVQLSVDETMLSLTVEDNGNGFDLAVVDRNGGTGLNNLRARVKAFNGCFDIDTAPGKGTAAYIEFNLNQLTGPACM
jgi:signal transduction histidine kinase